MYSIYTDARAIRERYMAKMSKPQTYQELYDRAMAEGKYADAASIKSRMEETDVGWSPLRSLTNANFVELSGLIYSCAWGYTKLRHEFAPYDGSQFRWRKHLFFLNEKAPIAMKGVGAYTAFCLILKGVSNRKS